MISVRFLRWVGVWVLALAPCVGATQTHPLLEQARQRYYVFDYPRAIQLYTQYYTQENAEDNWEIPERIADCYYKLAKYDSAAVWYADAVEASAPPPVWLQLGRMLLSTEQYTEAQAIFQRYADETGDSARVGQLLASCHFAIRAQDEARGYEVAPVAGINTQLSDYGAAEFNGELFYVSQTIRNDYDVFYVNPENATERTPVPGNINTREHHDGPVWISTDGLSMYFTRTSFNRFYDQTGQGPIHNLNLYSATLNQERGEWVANAPLPINQDEYSNGHATLSADGNSLVFSSTRRGGYGMSDLYVIRKNSEGQWGNPINLGPRINTAGDELFPWLHSSGVLFFSSNGHVGMGELDVYFCQPDGNKWAAPTNMGNPLNTGSDDFALSWTEGTDGGFIASNREGGVGDDDIYMFGRQTPVYVSVRNGLTSEPISGASLTLSGNGPADQARTRTDGSGTVFASQPGAYSLRVSAPGFGTESQNISTENLPFMGNVAREVILWPADRLRLDATVVDAQTGRPIPNAKLVINRMELDETVYADAQGRISVPLVANSNYSLVCFAAGYTPHIEGLATTAGEREVRRTLRLAPGGGLVVQGYTQTVGAARPVGDATIRVGTTVPDSLITTQRSDAEGKFWVVMAPNREYSLVASREGYFVGRVNFAAPALERTDTIIRIGLLPMVEYEVGSKVREILYAYDDTTIFSQYHAALMDIVYFLTDNPAARVEFGSHADSRGPRTYNQSLSERRSRACVSFLIRYGIDPSRVVAKGYGETRLLNNCQDGVVCTDDAHRQNRRTEIYIIGIDDDGHADAGSSGGQ